jgi:hypothetical protein
MEGYQFPEEVFGVPIHQKLMIFKQCVVTATNWGPLLDAKDDSKDEYKDIDIFLGETLKRIL